MPAIRLEASSMSHRYYIPNVISLPQRLAHFLGGLLLLGYGAWGLYVDDLYLPARHGGWHLHGSSAWIMAGALACGALVLLAVVVDHYDRRNNEIAYERFGRWAARGGWLCFCLALGFDMVGLHLSPGSGQWPELSRVGLGLLVALVFLFLSWLRAGASTVLQPGSGPAVRPGFLGMLLLILALPVILLAGWGYLRSGAWPGLGVLAAGLIVAALAVHLLRPASVLPASSLRVGVLLLIGGLLLAVGGREAMLRRLADQPAAPLLSEAEREQARQAPSWRSEWRSFAVGMPVDRAKALYAADGLQAKCRTQIQPEYRLRPDDTEVCWMPVRDLWGVPAVMAVLWFGEDGLHQMKFDLPPESWEGLEAALDARGSRASGNFGSDELGTPLRAWVIGGVLVLSAPDVQPGGKVTVLWNPGGG